VSGRTRNVSLRIPIVAFFLRVWYIQPYEHPAYGGHGRTVIHCRPVLRGHYLGAKVVITGTVNVTALGKDQRAVKAQGLP